MNFTKSIVCNWQIGWQTYFLTIKGQDCTIFASFKMIDLYLIFQLFRANFDSHTVVEG